MAEPVLVPRRREDIIDNNGNLTLRFTKFLESLTLSANTATEEVNDNAENILLNKIQIAINAALIQQNTDAIQDNTDSILENKQAIDEIPVFSGFMAQLQFIQRQIDGLPEFTIDTTGFTFDSTKITFDKVIA